MMDRLNIALNKQLRTADERTTLRLREKVFFLIFPERKKKKQTKNCDLQKKKNPGAAG